MLTLHVLLKATVVLISLSSSQARRKSEELKSELSDSSKRNSLVAESGSSKRSSLFSPEGSDGGEASRKLSLKSSAQAVRFLNKGGNMVRICLGKNQMFLEWFVIKYLVH